MEHAGPAVRAEHAGHGAGRGLSAVCPHCGQLLRTFRPEKCCAEALNRGKGQVSENTMSVISRKCAMDGNIMRICIVQMNVVRGDREANRAAVARLVGEAVRCSPSPDVVVLPELWSTGYDLEHAAALASPMGRDDAAFLGMLAVRHQVAFVGGSVLSERDGRMYNRAQVIDRQGRYVAGYDKIHLFRLMHEDRYLTPGDARLLLDFEGMRCGFAICYDIRFCELARRLAVDGAQVLFVSAEWPMPRSSHWETLLQARAVENQMYVAACNRCGVSDGEEFAGHSMIVAPDGTVLARAGSGEECIVADLDIDIVRRTRSAIPVFQDRVPRLY